MAADGSCAWRSTVAGRILNIRGFSVALTQPNDLKHCRFDPLSPAALANPYPFYAWLREHDPLHWGIGSSGEGEFLSRGPKRHYFLLFFNKKSFGFLLFCVYVCFCL